MALRSQFPVLKEEPRDSIVPEMQPSDSIVPEMLYSVISAFQDKQKALVSREDKLKTETEEKKKFQEKFEAAMSDKLSLEKECRELKEMSSRLREEQDEVVNRLKKKEDDYKKEICEIKRKNCELENEKLKVETDLNISEKRIKELEGKVLSIEKHATAQINTGLGVQNIQNTSAAGKRNKSPRKRRADDFSVSNAQRKREKGQGSIAANTFEKRLMDLGIIPQTIAEVQNYMSLLRNMSSDILFEHLQEFLIQVTLLGAESSKHQMNLESLKLQLKNALEELAKAKELQKKSETDLEKEKIARQKAKEAMEEWLLPFSIKENFIKGTSSRRTMNRPGGGDARK